MASVSQDCCYGHMDIEAATPNANEECGFLERQSIYKMEASNPTSSILAMITKWLVDLIWDKWSSWNEKNGAARTTRAHASPSDRLLPFIDIATENPDVIIAFSQAPAKISDANLDVPRARTMGPLQAGVTVSVDTLSIPAPANTTPTHETENSEKESPATDVRMTLSGQAKEASSHITSVDRVQDPNLRKAAVPAITPVTASEVMAAAARVRAAALQVQEAAAELQVAAAGVQQAAAQVKESRDYVATSESHVLESKEMQAIAPSQVSDHSPSSQLIKKMSKKFHLKRLSNLIPSPEDDAKFRKAFSPVSSGSSNGEDDQAMQVIESAPARSFENVERMGVSYNERHGGTLRMKLTTKLAIKTRSGVHGYGSEARFHRKASWVSDGSTGSGKRRDGEEGHGTFDQKAVTVTTDNSGPAGLLKILSGRLVGRFRFRENSKANPAAPDCWNEPPGSYCAAPIVPETGSIESYEPVSDNGNITPCPKSEIKQDIETVLSSRKTSVSSSTRVAKALIRFCLLDGLTNAHNEAECCDNSNEDKREKVKKTVQFFESRLESVPRHDGQEKRLSVRELIELFEALESQDIPEAMAIDAAEPLEESSSENCTIETDIINSVVDSPPVELKVNTSSPEDFRFVCSPIHVDSIIMG